jgi:hypothetical protein
LTPRLPRRHTCSRSREHAITSTCACTCHCHVSLPSILCTAWWGERCCHPPPVLPPGSLSFIPHHTRAPSSLPL